MFKNLKLKFMLIYSLSIFILTTLSFVFIFYFSYLNTYSLIEKKLVFSLKPQTSTSHISKEPNPMLIPNPFLGNSNENIKIFGDDMFFLVDSNLDIIDVATKLELSEEQLNSFQKEFYNTSSNKFNYNGETYIYSYNNNIIKVLNITHQINTLYSLAIILIFVEILILLSSIIIGYIFSSKSLKPVQESYNKQITFVSDASHEIKTPISVISSCLELIKNKDDESEKWIDYCISETKRLQLLTSSLLELTTDDFNVNTKEITPYNLSKQLELLICAFEVSLFEDNFNLNLDIANNLYNNMFEDDFKQLFHILIDNAIKYNNKNKQINISLQEEKNYINLTISNTTDYISPEDLNNIFNRFYRKDSARNKNIEGFGLGLAQCKKILDKYKLKYNIQYANGLFVFSMLLHKK